MKNRNVIIELARFLFSILVVGYHVQMSMNNTAADFFENGALAVEFEAASLSLCEIHQSTSRRSSSFVSAEPFLLS